MVRPLGLKVDKRYVIRRSQPHSNPNRSSAFQQDGQVGFITAPAFFVVKINGTLVRVVKAAHAAVVVNPQLGIAAGSARIEFIHAIGRRGEDIPRIPLGLLNGAIIRFPQFERIIACRTWCAIKVDRFAVIIVTTRRDLDAILVEGITTRRKNSIAV